MFTCASLLKNELSVFLTVYKSYKKHVPPHETMQLEDVKVKVWVGITKLIFWIFLCPGNRFLPGPRVADPCSSLWNWLGDCPLPAITGLWVNLTNCHITTVQGVPRVFVPLAGEAAVVWHTCSSGREQALLAASVRCPSHLWRCKQMEELPKDRDGRTWVLPALNNDIFNNKVTVQAGMLSIWWQRVSQTSSRGSLALTSGNMVETEVDHYIKLRPNMIVSKNHHKYSGLSMSG